MYIVGQPSFHIHVTIRLVCFCTSKILSCTNLFAASQKAMIMLFSVGCREYFLLNNRILKISFSRIVGNFILQLNTF